MDEEVEWHRQVVDEREACHPQGVVRRVGCEAQVTAAPAVALD